MDLTPFEKLGTLKPFHPTQRAAHLAIIDHLDEIRLRYYRAFDGAIEISIRKNKYNPRKQYTVNVRQQFGRTTKNDPPKEEYREIDISEAAFSELEEIVLDDKLYQDSVGKELILPADGSCWLLEGQKNGLIVTHQRVCPLDEPDRAFVSVGLRILSLAKVQISEKELY